MSRAATASAGVPSLEQWTGAFGDAYVDRNAFSPAKLKPGMAAFERMLPGRGARSILEVGSNVGLNLRYVRALRPTAKLFAVEPNAKAFAQLTREPSLALAGAWQASAQALPLADDSVDLAFTCGVLIHVPPDELGRATDEIVRVSRRYVLCAEYFSHTPTEAPYRGQSGLLFKRDFGAWYADRFPQLRCTNYGFLWQRELPAFDNIHWWLFKKRSSR